MPDAPAKSNADLVKVTERVASGEVDRPQGIDTPGRPLQPGGEPFAMAALGPGPGITRNEIIVRAESWLHPPVPYSQSAFKDGYRTDCSGYVSMAWKTNRNYWTGDLNTIGVAIAYNDLRPGDMLLYHNSADPVDGSHVVLFDRWVKEVGGDFWFYEQCGDGGTKHHPWSQAGYNRPLYKPFRYVNAIAGAPQGPSARGDRMQPGQVLNPGESIASANGRFRFSYQADGNLVLYRDKAALWASGTNGRGVGVCIMQADGNLVLYTSDGTALWASGTSGFPGSYLVVQDDGNVAIYRPALWSTNTWVPIGPSAQGDRMQPGQVLNPGESIASANGRFRFSYQADGNLVLYRDKAALWASGTNGRVVGVCIMQADGNLVLYGPGGMALWASGTSGFAGSYLTVQDDDKVVIHRPDGDPVWASSAVQ
jgi:hypothetical protein